VRSSNRAIRTLAFATVLATLAGCSEYLDRRDTIAPSAGNAVATNEITQMVDPWPRESADRNIAFNGARMESAFERYRTGRVIQPKGTGTSGTYEQSQGAQNNTAPVGPTVNQPVGPVK
jgi:hypothetical protein